MMMSGRRAALRAAVLSSRKMNVLSARPCLAISLLERRFSAQMQTDDHEPGGDKQPDTTSNSSFKISKAEYREILDKMMKKTAKMEDSMEALKKTYAKKKERAATATTIKWMDTSEMDRLFDESGKHKQVITQELAELKSLLKDASAAKFNAVNAPDGESDWHIKEELEEIQHIIDDAAVLENKDEILQRRKAAYNAVDAPDGESDGRLKEEMEHVNHIIDDAAVLENKDEIMKQRKMQEEGKRIFAVDAPDGDSDGHVQEELLEINHIIDDASAIEDKNSVEYKHMMEAQVRKDRARDPEHDW